MESNKALKGRNLLVRYGRSTILKQVSFAAKAGELVGILGPSGSGKSTLLMALSGFRPAREGTVTFHGRNLYKDFDHLKQDIGFVPQDDVVPTSLKVEKVLKYAAELRLPHFDKTTREGRVQGVIQKLGLAEKKKLRVGKLSGGQRKRVSVAVELLGRPSLFFADEPTSGLDPALEEEMTQHFKSMASEGRIVVVTTHIMSSLALFDAVCMLHQGHLVYFGPPNEIKSYFAVDDFVQIYKKLSTQDAAKWEAHYQSSSLHTTFMLPRFQG